MRLSFFINLPYIRHSIHFKKFSANQPESFWELFKNLYTYCTKYSYVINLAQRYENYDCTMVGPLNLFIFRLSIEYTLFSDTKNIYCCQCVMPLFYTRFYRKYSLHSVKMTVFLNFTKNLKEKCPKMHFNIKCIFSLK